MLFLPSATDRSEKHNQYVDSVRLWPIDIKSSDFGKNFDPSKLDQVNDVDREKTRECVLNILRKLVDLSNQNLIGNAIVCLLRDHTTSKMICGMERKEKTCLRSLLFPIENDIYNVYV